MTDPHKNVRKNLQVYSESAERAAEEGSEIIVFPEEGLFVANQATDAKLTLRESIRLLSEDVPDPKDGPVNPCTQEKQLKDRPILQSLACIARTNSIYLVASLTDVKKCKKKNCSEDGYLMYNTQVAFDRRGYLIGRYHKYHLYGEYYYNVPEKEFVYFDTDFGARIGMHICFDRLFHDPMITLVEQFNVSTMALSTWFFDEHPFLVSHQIDQSWSIGLGINILSSNSKFLATGSTGSGIFSPKNMAGYVHDTSTSGRVTYPMQIVGTIPVDPRSGHNCDPDPWIVKQSKYRQRPGQKYQAFYGDFKELVTREVVEPEGKSEQVCDDELCCTFNFRIRERKSNWWSRRTEGKKTLFMGAKSRVRKGYYVSNYTSYEQACFIIAFNKSTGVYETQATHVFQELEISGNFSTKYQYPGALSTDFRLIENDEMIFTKNQLAIDTRRPLIYAGIFARIYDRDPDYDQHQYGDGEGSESLIFGQES